MLACLGIVSAAASKLATRSFRTAHSEKHLLPSTCCCTNTHLTAKRLTTRESPSLSTRGERRRSLEICKSRGKAQSLYTAYKVKRKKSKAMPSHSTTKRLTLHNYPPTLPSSPHHHPPPHHYYDYHHITSPLPSTSLLTCSPHHSPGHQS